MPEDQGLLNVMPEGQGKRNAKQPRYDLIPLSFLTELASVFAEGLAKYGEDSWKQGGEDFLRDCLNHVQWHLSMYMQGDRGENHLAKVAWGALAVRWNDKCDDSYLENHLEEPTND